MTTTWTERSSISTDWEGNFLLQELGDYLLQETGDKIIINKALSSSTSWTDRVSP